MAILGEPRGQSGKAASALEAFELTTTNTRSLDLFILAGPYAFAAPC